MKFILLVGAVVLTAGGAAFLLTGQQSASAAPPSLAGDWRCNTKTKHGSDVLEGNLLMSIAEGGATKGRALFNSPMQGHTVTLEATFTGDTRVTGNQLHETTTNVEITEASVDGQQAPATIRASLRDDLFAETGTYNVREFTASRLVYANEDSTATCEPSPVPLDL